MIEGINNINIYLRYFLKKLLFKRFINYSFIFISNHSLYDQISLNNLRLHKNSIFFNIIIHQLQIFYFKKIL